MNDERIEVTLKCGHKVKHSFYGTPGAAREAVVAWLGANRECRQCRLERERRELEQNTRATRKELGSLKFPELIAPTTTPWATPLDRASRAGSLEGGRRGRERYLGGHEDWSILNDTEQIKNILFEVIRHTVGDGPWPLELGRATTTVTNKHRVPTSLKRYAIEHRTAAEFWRCATTASQIELIYEWAYDLAARGEAEATQE